MFIIKEYKNKVDLSIIINSIQNTLLTFNPNLYKHYILTNSVK
jgi:hypothetical protein